MQIVQNIHFDMGNEMIYGIIPANHNRVNTVQSAFKIFFTRQMFLYRKNYFIMSLLFRLIPVIIHGLIGLRLLSSIYLKPIENFHKHPRVSNLCCVPP